MKKLMLCYLSALAAGAAISYATGFGQSGTQPPLTIEAAKALTAEQKSSLAPVAGDFSRPAAPLPVRAVQAAPKKSSAKNLFSEDFSQSDALTKFEVIDANKDGRTWTIQDEQARVQYSMQLQMDDWMITPSLHLEKGKAYTVSVDVRMQASYGNPIEVFEVKAGTSRTAEGMTISVIGETQLNYPDDKAYHTYTGEIVPAETGEYYVGIHGISPKAQNYLYVDNLTISEPIVAIAPDAVSELTITPAPNGVLQATIAFTTPSKDLNGDELTELDRVEVIRGETLVHTFEKPGVDTPLSFIDSDIANEGLYSYSVVSYNSGGKGKAISAEAYVGTGLPAALTEAHVTETATNGEVTISWEPVTVNAYGTAIDPAAVSYNIYVPRGNTRSLVIEGVRGSSYTCVAAPEDMQGFVQYLVYPATAKGESDGAPTEIIPVGKPYDGIHESGSLDYAFSVDASGGGDWSTASKSTVGYPAQDDDDLFFAMIVWNTGEYSDLISGKISLAGLNNPTLTFYTFHAYSDIEPKTDNINEITVMAKAAGEKDFTPLKTTVMTETGPVNTWNRVVVDLDAYKGKVIQLLFRAKAVTYQTTSIDNIKVADIHRSDLGIISFNAPAKVKPGDAYTVTVKVSNEGLDRVEAYTVNLIVDGNKVESKAGAALEGGESASVEFAGEMHRLATEPLTVSAEIVMTGDTNEANDKSAPAEVAPVVSRLPAVTDLTGSTDGSSIKLAWTAPDPALAPADPVTENFESASSFAMEFDGWTFVDADATPIGGIKALDIPGITPGQTKASFFVFDGAYPDDKDFNAHSGSKYLLSMFRYDYGQVDDWAITPVLDGSEQTVSLWVRSFSAEYPESVELYYSNGSIDPDDFIMVGEAHNLPVSWTQLTAELPEGAKRFAVRACAKNNFMLLVDDVTFVPEGAKSSASISGYNIFRNGAQINEEPVTEPAYSDSPAEAGPHTYVVTTVYNQGESKPSNAVSLQYSGIADVTDDAHAPAEYYNLQGMRISSPAPGSIVIRRQGAEIRKVLIK